MSVHPQPAMESAGEIDRDRRETAGEAGREAGTPREPRRRQRLQWGVVHCPDGPHRVDLGAMRRAMTRMLVAGELNDQPMENLGRKAGMSRSTVSRIFSGQAASLKRLLALLVVLDLNFDDVVEAAVINAAQIPNQRMTRRARTGQE